MAVDPETLTCVSLSTAARTRTSILASSRVRGTSTRWFVAEVMPLLVMVMFARFRSW